MHLRTEANMKQTFCRAAAPAGRARVAARLLGLLGLLGLAPVALSAQGSAVYTQSSCMNGRNGAGIAAPCEDGSAVYYNPGALAQQNGAVSLGVSIVENGGTFTYDRTGQQVERPTTSVSVPHAWASYRLSPRLAVGLGLWAPYGLSLEWPVCPTAAPECGDGFEGRFVGYDQSLRALYLQPTVAYQLLPGRLSIGGGVDIVRGEVEINRRLDLSEQLYTAGPLTLPLSQIGIPNDTDFADVRLEGDGYGVTGHIGALFRVTRAISIGARYMHGLDLGMDGTADFRQIDTNRTIGPLPPFLPVVDLDSLLAESVFADGGAAADQDVSTSIPFPAQAVVGIAVQLDADLRVMFDYQWTKWSVWDSVVIDFASADDQTLILDYQDANTYRLGADYRLGDKAVLHGGFSYNTPAAKPASVSPFLPDAERTFLSGGVTYRATERIGLDVFFMNGNVADRRGRVLDRDSFDQTAEELNEGIYTSEGTLFGATLTYHFGGAR